MINPSGDVPKRPRGRPSSPSRTDLYREETLHRVIASVHPRPGSRLKPLVKLVIDGNGGPQDEREIRRIRDRYLNHFERPQEYDRIGLRDAEHGTRARIRADSPDLSEAMWNGWFPVKATNGELIIERHLSPRYRFLTQEEGGSLAEREFEGMLIGMGTIRVAMP